MARFRASRFSRAARAVRPTPPKAAPAETENSPEAPRTASREAGIPRGRPLIREKPASRSTAPAEEGDHRSSTAVPDHADGPVDAKGAAGAFRASDFTSRAAAAGVGGLADADPATAAPGADQIPGNMGDAVTSSLAGEETTLIDPTEMTNDGPAGAAEFATERTSGWADLRGRAAEADKGSSMADYAGISEETTEATTTTTEATTEATSSAETTQTEGTVTSREYLSGNSDGAGQSLDTDNMSDADVAEATAVEVDYAVAIEPGRAYLSGNTELDVDAMSNEQVVEALDREAAAALRGERNGPRYMDADSGGEVEGGEQVARDFRTLRGGFNIHNPTTPGNVDPSNFGGGATEAQDTSTLDLSHPGSATDAASFGGGATGTAPATAGVDYGEDHVDSNPAAGPYDDAGGIGLVPDDGTVDLDLGGPDEPAGGNANFDYAETVDYGVGIADGLADEMDDVVADDFDI